MSEHEIKQQLEAIFGVYRGTDYEDGVIGIAHSASATDLAPKVERHFELDQIDQAAKYADAKSKEGCNIYVVSGLLFGVKDQRSSAVHFYASKWVVADVDENWERSRAAIKAADLKPRIYVRTAEAPETRVQAWFELNDITDDIDDVRAAGRALTAALCADASSIDTGTHLFRLAGTTNYPTEHKKANGRKAEPVALNIARDAPKYDVYALSQLKPHPEYDHAPKGGVGNGGAALGIVRDENGKVTDGREDYWRSIVLASISNYQKNNGADPTVDEVFDDCYPTFEQNITGDDRWTSHHGRLALRQRVCNTARRLKKGYLAEHGLYSYETGVNREKAELVAAARAEKTTNHPDVKPKINWMRLSDLAEREIKEREWTVEGWIPKGQVTLLYADGGVGKSQIILQLLTSVSLGESWFGRDTSKGSALYLGAEDDTDELHRRFHDVINARFKSYADFPDVIFSSLAGEDALLANYDPRSKKLSPSAVMKELTAAIAKHTPSICVIDTLADVFPADENDRALARQFIGLLRKPAIEHKCALVVLAHPSLSGISTGRGTSGSTGWNNSVRSRITMERDENNSDRRILKLAKSNYSKIGTEIVITWENGVFVHDPQSSGLDAQAANSKAKRVFLSLLENHNENGMSVNANGGSTYAPKVFAEHPHCEGVTKKAFVIAMKSLFAEKVIRAEKTKRGTHLLVSKR